MKAKQIVLGAGVLVLIAVGLGFWSHHSFPQKAPAAAGVVDAAAALETRLEADVSPEDQGYVDCPDESEVDDAREPVQAPEGLACVEALLPFGHAPQPWTEASTLASLEALCGPVFADFLFYHGEGRCQWGTAMFHGTGREIQIIWNNWSLRRNPRLLRFVGAELHFAEGLRPGLLLRDLVALNGKSIIMTGFGGEGSGFHRSFQAGKLSRFDQEDAPYRIHYTLDWDLFDNATEEESANLIIGRSPLDSSTPALEKFKAQVEYIEYRFAKDDESAAEPR